MTKYGPEYLKRLISAVETFQEAFEKWMKTQVESDHMNSRGLLPTVWTKEGQDEAKVRALELAVAEAAGLTANAVEITGAKIVVKGIGVVDPSRTGR